MIEQTKKTLWMCSVVTWYAWCSFMDAIRITREISITVIWKALPCQIHYTELPTMKCKKDRGQCIFHLVGPVFYYHWVCKCQKLRHKTAEDVKVTVHPL